MPNVKGKWAVGPAAKQEKKCHLEKAAKNIHTHEAAVPGG